MELVDRTLYYSRTRGPLVIYLLGDIHLGTVSCSESLLRQVIGEIKENPYAYWLDIGDKIEAINISDPRFDINSLPDWILDKKDKNVIPLLQANKYIEYFKPIAKKCLGLSVGNHEYTVSKKYHNDIHGYIAMNLGVPSLGASAIIDLALKDENKKVHDSRKFRIVTEHGYSAARTDGAKINNIKASALHFANINLYVSGHGHTKLIGITTQLDKVGNVKAIVSENKIYSVQVPSFFRSYVQGHASYAEVKSYPPTSLGVTKCKIVPYKNLSTGSKETWHQNYIMDYWVE